MKRYVLLLRGVNVGGNNRVSMARLKSILVELGFLNVITYLNSGNAVFDSKESQANLIRMVAKALKKEFKFDIDILIISGKDVASMASKIPPSWQNDKDQKTDVLFLWDEYDNKNSLKEINATSVDNLIYTKGAIIWNVSRKDYSKSVMNKFVGTKLYKHMTARNVNTVRKLKGLL